MAFFFFGSEDHVGKANRRDTVNGQGFVPFFLCSLFEQRCMYNSRGTFLIAFERWNQIGA